MLHFIGARTPTAAVIAASLVVALVAPRRSAALSPPAVHHPGQWTAASPWPGRRDFATSVHAVHLALLRGDTLFGRPHSQVLAWGGWSPSDSDGGLWAWKPSTDAPAQAGSNLSRLAVPAPPYNVFCAGHASVPDASGDLLIVGGTQRGVTGENRSARFRALDRQWLERPMQFRRWYANATPLPGVGAADGRVLATAGWMYDHMVLFGGRRTSGGTVVNDVQRYAITNEGHWDPPLTDPTPGTSPPDWPEPRESPTLADQIEGPYFLFGGRDAAGTRRDVWQLARHDHDLGESYRWTPLSPGNSVSTLNRWRHTAVAATSDAIGRSSPYCPMYVHGGERISGSTTTTLGDLWRLEWVAGVSAHWQWVDLTSRATGSVPSARSGHAAAWDKQNQRMILFGGRNSDGSITDANVYVCRFSNGTPTWTIAVPRDPNLRPAARTRHALAVDKINAPTSGIVFGGLRSGSVLSNELWEWTLSSGGPRDTVTWLLRPPGSTAPAPRSGATAILYEMHPRSYVVAGGELAGGTADSSVWELRRDTNAWSRHPALPRALTGHVAFREVRANTALQPEVYDPATDTWTPFGGKKKLQSYHMSFLASDGNVYSPGPNRVTRDTTWRFDPRTGAWALYATNNSTYLDDTVAGILFRPDRFMKCGGMTSFAVEGHTFSLQSRASGLAPTWLESLNRMTFARGDHTLNMLPTGEVIASGGTGMHEDSDHDPDDAMPCKRPSIWDPTWVGPGLPAIGGFWYGGEAVDTLAAEPVTRGHHSSAVILPDGRLLSAGGWDYHPASVRNSVDQFSPPYLFREDGTSAFRPRLHGAQEHITWDQYFKVACPEHVVEACLIRPGASTHGFNQDCRFVPLTVVHQMDHRVTLHSPPSQNHAPPGNYLLFVLAYDPVSHKRVPSIARWVNLGRTQTSYATWDTLAPAAVLDLTVTGVTTTTHTLRWTAPADLGEGSSGRATRYELRYRRAISMPTLEDFFASGTSVASLPAPAAAGTPQTITVTGLAPGASYYFRLISRDGAGSDRNWSPLSNEAGTPGALAVPGAPSATPERFAIHAPRPNPFAATTLLRFELPAGRHVRVELLDVTGRRVRTLADQPLPAGVHTLEWDGRGGTGQRVPAGLYFYHFEAGEFRSRGRLTYLP